jgi:DNA helicase-2/ATP-dependent DNA helicase PcrA
VKLHINKQLHSLKKTSDTTAVRYIHCSKSDEEVKIVVEKITELRETNSEISWGDFAILVRANNHAEYFIQALQKQGIPYEFLASSGLFRQPLVMDCINFFKLLNDYHESSALYRLLCMPNWHLKENDLQKITYNAKKKSISYYEALKRAREWGLSEEGVIIADKLLAVVHEGMKQTRTTKPSVILYSFLEQSGYLTYLTQEEEKNNRVIIQQIKYLNQFFEKLTAYETATTETVSVAAFLRQHIYILESGDEGELEQPTDADVVKVMTVHASKGLEFKYVFIVNLVEERFPTRKRGESLELPTALIHEQLPQGDAHYQEERRLFYVALTRAKEKVFLLSSQNYGGVRDKKVSRFIKEIEIVAEHPYYTATLAPQTLETNPDNLEEKYTYELPKAFSFSQLKSYETCPYQYKLANIIKIPNKGNAHFSFGQTIHSTLQKFYERIQELNRIEQTTLFNFQHNTTLKSEEIKIPTLDELLKLYDQCWIDDWYKDALQKDKYYEKGKNLLKEFYLSQQQWTIPVSLEGWFKIKLNDFTIHGRIDRIDQLADGTLEIIDYKTGASKEKVVGEEKDQLLIYQIATEQLPQYQHLGKPSKLTFYYVNDNIKVSFLGEPKELEKLQTKLAEIIKKIRLHDFTATPNPYTCNSCDFKDICEYRIL